MVLIFQSIKAESKKKLTLLKMELDKNELTIWDILVRIKIFKNIHGKINLKKETTNYFGPKTTHCRDSIKVRNLTGEKQNYSEWLELNGQRT